MNKFRQLERFSRSSLIRQLCSFRPSKYFSQSKPANFDLKITGSSQDNMTMLSIIPPERVNNIERTPTSLVCVIDVSGSMSSRALIKTSDGQNYESYGLSILDLVKHSLKTIIASMTEDDRLALVAFSNNAETVLNLTTMDDDGKQKANEAVDKLRPLNLTNLWDGLQFGLNNLKARENDIKHTKNAVLLLTDGLPNIVPPRGHIPQLQKYIQDNGDKLVGEINTFGFGYGLDSNLLDELSFIGNGSYSFIPDASMVGTVFIHSLAGILSSIADNVEIELSLENFKVSQKDLLKNYKIQYGKEKMVINLGSINYGQKKSLILPGSFIDPKNKVLRGTLKYNPFSSNEVITPFEYKIDNNDDLEVMAQNFRINAGNKLLDIVGNLNKSNEKWSDQLDILSKFISKIKGSPANTDEFPYIKDLLKDLEEQASIALSKIEYYQKWGRHYIPSLARSHLKQSCNNFKDPGVQHFGGEIFKNNRDKLDNIFLSLPPPQPSGARGANLGNLNIATNLNVNNGGILYRKMSVFHDKNNVCFAGDCFALMWDGSKKLVKNIKKGDIVISHEGKPAKVVCVVKSIIENNKVKLVNFEGGLKITPWHPVRINNEFYFPHELAEEKIMNYSAVYNFVLDKNHLININGIECVTLGHNFRCNRIVEHEYFGSEKLIKDLERFKGWENGFIEVESHFIGRDEKTGRICEISHY